MDTYRTIGKSILRKDALEKVTGTAVYGADVILPRMLYAAVSRSPHPHARIVRLDTAEAAAMPGVKAILTGADNPGLFGQFIADQPVLAVGKVRYEGEPVAAVAAETPLQAAEAVRRIVVDYEVLPPILDPVQAAKEGSPLVHESWAAYMVGSAASPIEGTNVCDHFRLRKGDVEAGFRAAEVIVEDDYSGRMVQHALMETHCATARWDEAGLTVWTPAQSPFIVREQLEKLFHLSMNKVRVICTQVGGGFGGKWEVKLEPIVALLAQRLRGRPVKLVNSRHEEFLAGGARNPWTVHIKTGAKRDGSLVAQEMTVHWDTGAYTTAGPRINYNACYAAGSPYRIPNVAVDGYSVITNKHIATAYRGFGVPEVVWAYENQMDVLAGKLGMDRLELRMRNALDDGDESASGEILRSVGLRDCLAEAGRLIGWDRPLAQAADGKLRGRAIAAFCKLTGTPSTSSVVIKLNEDGSLTVLQSGMELGQGLTTVIPQIVAESMGVSVDKVSLVPVDTLYTPFEKTTTSSRLTFHVGNAALAATEDLKAQIRTLAAAHWKTRPEDVRVEGGRVSGRDGAGAERGFAMDDIAKSGIMKERDPLVGRGQYSTIGIFDPPDRETHHSARPTIMWFWGAHAAEVEVDTGTGAVRVLRIACANDIGKAINPLGLLQQIEGGAVMAMGHALLEEMIFEEGILRNGSMVDYKIPTMRDGDPEVLVSLVETHPHPEGPYGAKGIGEPGMAGVAAAIGAAVSDAVGSRFRTQPIKADEILAALLAGKGGRPC